MSIMELTSDNFDQTIESHAVLVVDFWAEWCGPCRAFGKTMLEVSALYPDVVFASVDVEREKELAEEFAVRSIPFVMIVRNRTVVYAESGVLTALGLRELIDKAKALNPADLQS